VHFYITKNIEIFKNNRRQTEFKTNFGLWKLKYLIERMDENNYNNWMLNFNFPMLFVSILNPVGLCPIKET